MVGYQNDRRPGQPSRIPRRVAPTRPPPQPDPRPPRSPPHQHSRAAMVTAETNANQDIIINANKPPTPARARRVGAGAVLGSPVQRAAWGRGRRKPSYAENKPSAKLNGQQQSPTRNEMSPTKSLTASPVQCVSRASSTSDNHAGNQSLNGLLYSPEDALNNDFFYDDEFSVPFDANLGENETNVVDVEMLDSMDINTLLMLSRVYDDNQEPIINRLVTSKSDTCLYHQMSSSGDMPADVETSGDQSMSDQCTSSAELSELRNEPLFSPPPSSGPPTTLHQYSTDSLGRDEPLSGSFTMGDETRYTYDWSANKGQYTLSFDSRGHRHQSDDDSSLSYHDSIPSSQMTSSLTSWAQKSRDSNNFMLWGSRDSLGLGALSSGGSTPARGSPKHGPRHKQAEQPLTTWSKVKEDRSDSPSRKEKLTTWRSLRETKQVPAGKEEDGRSKSLPDMREKTKPRSEVAEADLSPREGAEETLVDIEVEDECINKRSTTSLFELFQRLRSQEEIGENMVSSATMQMLTGAWSMSPVNSEQSAPLSERSPSVPCLTSWNTMKDLASRNSSLRTSTADSIDSSIPDKVESASNSLQHSNGCQTRLFTSFACNTSYHERPRSDAECGSLILTQSLIYGKDNKDFCGQFPPNARDMSVQTSFEYGVPVKSLINRSLQTSLGSSIESNKGDTSSPLCQSTPQQTSTKERSKLHTFRDLASKRQDTTHKQPPPPLDPTVEPLKKSEPSLTSSLLFSNSALPDLSFLNKGMTQSISSFLEQASKPQPIFNPRMVRADTLAGHVDMSIGREALSREKKKKASKQSTLPPSREISPGLRGNLRRHNTDSSSSTSVCSTSSSGIDSGCYESSQYHSPRGNVQYFSDLGLFSPSVSDSSTLSESSGSSPSISRSDLFSTPLMGTEKNGASKVQDPQLTRVKCVTSFAELANQQHQAGSTRPALQVISLSIPQFKPKPEKVTKVAVAQAHSKEPVVKSPISKATVKRDAQRSSSPRKKPQVFSMENRNADKVIPPPKPPRLNICEECQAQHNEMISSVPVYSEPLYKMVARPVKQVEYLQVSPTHRPYTIIGIPLGAAPPCRAGGRHQHGADCLCGGYGGQQLKKPLKSCLVKRRRVRKNLFKHRSYSDSHDLAVMKYSQEGQTRYQLIAPSSCDQECVHGLSMGATGFTSLPADALQESLREQVKKRLSQQDLPVLPLTSPACSPPVDGHPATQKPVISNSPDLIPVMPCPCRGTGTASITSHSSDDSCSDCAEANRHKKSVSFSEEVFYHSPYNSPRGSPKKPQAPTLGSQGRAATLPACKTTHSSPAQSQPVPVRGHNGEVGTTDAGDTGSETGSDDTPPFHFVVSPSTSPTPGVAMSLPPYTASGIDLTHKKELVLEVVAAAEHVLAHFAKTRDPAQKMRLGSTAVTPEVGHLILRRLCPAIHAVLLDGLKPHVTSLFGRMRNSVWKVVEDSAELGPSTRVIHELVRDLKNLDFLSTNWLKVNAFIFGLLNHKALDFWLTYVHNQESLLVRHYTPESFLYLSATAGRALFVDLTTALQPLAQLPLRLEYQLEYQVLQQQEQKRLSDYLLDKHVANAEHAYLESQRALTNAANMNSADTRASAQSQMAIAQALGQQMQVGTKRLLGKIHQRGSFIESLSSVLPKMTPGRTTPSSPSADTLPGHPTLGPPGSPPASPADSENAVPIVWNNVVLDSPLEDSDDGLRTEEAGLLSRLTRQVKQLASPEKQVYKRGVTEYQFSEMTPRPVPSASSAVPEAPPKPVRRNIQKQSAVTTTGPPASPLASPPASPPHVWGQTSDDLPPGLITNSATDSGIDQVMEDMPPPQFDVVPRAAMPRNADPRKRWSDTAARWMGAEPGQGMGAGLTEVKKRWSSFGSNMLKMFDRLLVDDPAVKVESPPWADSPSPRMEALLAGSPAPPAWGQCETLVDLEQVLKEAPAGVQMLGVGCYDNGINTSVKLQQLQQHPVTTARTVTTQREERYVETLCALVSMTPEQLSFKQGERLKVIRQVEEDLLMCSLSDVQGFVHTACVKDVVGHVTGDTA